MNVCMCIYICRSEKPVLFGRWGGFRWVFFEKIQGFLAEKCVFRAIRPCTVLCGRSRVARFPQYLQGFCHVGPFFLFFFLRLRPFWLFSTFFPHFFQSLFVLLVKECSQMAQNDQKNDQNGQKRGEIPFLAHFGAFSTSFDHFSQLLPMFYPFWAIFVPFFPILLSNCPR